MALTIVKPENIAEYIGKDLGTTEWFTVDQDRINKFAEATEDHQFIHVDPEQAIPIFGSTIAHGFLSLALTAGIGQDIALVVEGAKMGLNYGLDKVRFLSPVPVNSRIRMSSVVMDITEKNPGQFLVKSSVTMEIEGVEKPAFIAETLSMWVL
ncbi:MaoC family dehydratase [Gammaproteobacteria bacterium]|nr:MaoC family dehydratase [Gammaproteobacteria bacterium]MDA9153908.1 MaoC family dehydratase [Gammaproteobacteria bacterium]MDA9341284.1 MaoC family dehydratase [Gammaproteobacteria bacterium]MDA9364922.1 MaoC family dehydratase [Gammaproteobacteria bacterium]MDA9371193.1 MaoC family dehydratase [Gammaproteobacteria bacterium]|tara:strand:- start:2231 stop:2689 length:459 start_codon:yes stop_codon:yes gene_type:complete